MLKNPCRFIALGLLSCCATLLSAGSVKITNQSNATWTLTRSRAVLNTLPVTHWDSATLGRGGVLEWNLTEPGDFEFCLQDEKGHACDVVVTALPGALGQEVTASITAKAVRHFNQDQLLHETIKGIGGAKFTELVISRACFQGQEEEPAFHPPSGDEASRTDTWASNQALLSSLWNRIERLRTDVAWATRHADQWLKSEIKPFQSNETPTQVKARSKRVLRRHLDQTKGDISSLTATVEEEGQVEDEAHDLLAQLNHLADQVQAQLKSLRDAQSRLKTGGATS